MDFETHPVGTAIRLKQLETEIARLNRVLTGLKVVAKRQIAATAELLDVVERAEAA